MIAKASAVREEEGSTLVLARVAAGGDDVIAAVA